MKGTNSGWRLSLSLLDAIIDEIIMLWWNNVDSENM